MARSKVIKKKRIEKVLAKQVKLPTLKPKEAWLDKSDRGKDIPEKIKAILYLPQIAEATAVYAHKNNLSHKQKDSLIRLFRMKADQALEIIHTHVQLTVGNSPKNRIGYLNDFESWETRLIALLREALNCSMDAETWTKKLEALTPDNEPLFYENRQEWSERLREHSRLKKNLFDKFVYFQKFSDFTREALKLIRRFSAMFDITMERTEWMYKALEKFGKLPENLKRNQSIKGRFTLKENQVLFDGRDLNVGAGVAVEILKSLVQNYGSIVQFRKLDENSPQTDASEKIRTAIRRIRIAIKSANIPVRIENRKAEGYIMLPST